MTRTIMLCAVVLASACTTDDPDATDEVDAATVTGMSVSGNHLLKDGALFMPRGFNTVGTLTPAWCGNGTVTTARTHFTSAELDDQVQKWHANIIRLQVSQRGLEDPSLTSSEITAYLNEIESHVALARSKGLVVILSMQDQSIGCGAVHPLPSKQTVNAWHRLAPVFANDLYVMYELFNEPENGTTSADWAQWKNGGASPLTNLGDTAVGHETLVTDLRSWGIKNVLIADGARYAEHLDGITNYVLTESSGRGIAYAIHPYYYTPGQTYWQTSWGFLTTTHPVIATEWNYKPSDCGTNAETLAPTLLSWLDSKNIGITAHVFDVVGLVIADWTYTPTKCGTASGGPGALLKSWYAHLATL